MRSFIHKHLQGILSLLFAVAIALFWAFPYRCALSYQEQYQLFLFTPSYFTERMSVPGGLADYVAEFITQFYYVYALGAILLALVFFCLQRLTWVLMRRSGVSSSWYLLSFIPAVALWALMGNENVLLSFAIALLGMEELMLHYIIVRDHNKGWQAPLLYLIVAIPAGYWLLGSVVLGLVFFIPIFPIARYRVIPTGGGYRFLGKGPLRTFDKWHIAISLGLIALMFFKG